MDHPGFLGRWKIVKGYRINEAESKSSLGSRKGKGQVMIPGANALEGNPRTAQDDIQRTRVRDG